MDTEAFWHAVAILIEFTRGIDTLTSPEIDALDDAISDSDPDLTWEYISTGAIVYVTGETWSGTSGNDTYTSTANSDALSGAAGNDAIHGGDGNDSINGDGDNDELWGDGGADTIYGGAGTNIIHGGIGNDTVYNSFGATDTIYGDAGEDMLSGGANADTIYGGDDDDEIYGNQDNDTLDGGAGNDEIDGGDGNDTISPGLGGNIVEGGSGNDTYIYQGGNDVYFEQTSSGTDVIELPGGVVLGDLTIFRKADASLHDLAISVDGFATIEVQDFFHISTGVVKGTIETLEFSDTSTFSLNAFTSMTTYGDNENNSFSGVYMSSDIIDVMYGFGGDDDLRADGGNDTLDGGSGNDYLEGGDGNDTYIFSPGFDNIADGSGTDTIVIPDGYTMGDISFFKSGTYGLNLLIDGLGQLQISSQLSGTGWAVETLHFEEDSSNVNFSSISVEQRGTSGNDTLDGMTAGVSTNDILDGMEGNDTLNGGSGDDTYVFSEGINSVSDVGGGTDKILFREGWAPEDVSVYRNGSSHLVVEDTEGNQMVATQHFTVAGREIESVEFSDSTTWNLLSMEIEIWGTSGNDSL